MSISIANRNQSWIDMQETLSKKRYEAYQWIKKHEPVSPQILCEIYDMRFNELAPRFTELFDIGYIKEYSAPYITKGLTNITRPMLQLHWMRLQM